MWIDGSLCVKLQYVIHISACHRLVKAQLNANLGVSEKFWNIVSLCGFLVNKVISSFCVGVTAMIFSSFSRRTDEQVGHPSTVH